MRYIARRSVVISSQIVDQVCKAQGGWGAGLGRWASDVTAVSTTGSRSCRGSWRSRPSSCCGGGCGRWGRAAAGWATPPGATPLPGSPARNSNAERHCAVMTSAARVTRYWQFSGQTILHCQIHTPYCIRKYRDSVQQREITSQQYTIILYCNLHWVVIDTCRQNCVYACMHCGDYRTTYKCTICTNSYSKCIFTTRLYRKKNPILIRKCNFLISTIRYNDRPPSSVKLYTHRCLFRHHLDVVGRKNSFSPSQPPLDT